MSVMTGSVNCLFVKCSVNVAVVICVSVTYLITFILGITARCAYLNHTSPFVFYKVNGSACILNGTGTSCQQASVYASLLARLNVLPVWCYTDTDSVYFNFHVLTNVIH